MWKDEIRLLWAEVAEVGKDRGKGRGPGPKKSRKGFGLYATGSPGPGSLSVKDLLAGSRFADAVLKFLKSTKVGSVKAGILDKRGRGVT